MPHRIRWPDGIRVKKNPRLVPGAGFQVIVAVPQLKITTVATGPGVDEPTKKQYAGKGLLHQYDNFSQLDVAIKANK
jgi:hypothetical protein